MAPGLAEDRGLLESMLEALPSVVAIPLADLANETHPVVRLWRVCDCAELLLRLCVFVGAAELHPRLPDEVAGILAHTIQRPTLHGWLQMAMALVRVHVGNRVVPELQASVEQVLHPLLVGGLPGGAQQGSEAALLPLRNDLAHGAGFGRTHAEAIVDAHVSRLHRALRDMSWLQDVVLVARGDGGVRFALRGTDPAGAAQVLTLDAALEATLSSPAGRVALVRERRALPLWPLFAFEPPEVSRLQQGDVRQSDVPAPLVYARSDRRKVDYTALKAAVPMAELRGDAVRELHKLFRLSETGSGGGAGTVREELEAEARSLVGRKAELDRVRTAVEATASGVLWMHGLPGRGKSALMAKLAVEFLERYESSHSSSDIPIVFRFRAGDGRATRDRFLSHSIDVLRRHLSLASSRPKTATALLEEELDSLIQNVREPARAVFVLDGLDEVSRTDADFPRLVLRHARGRSLWLCAGRPEPGLNAAFAPDAVCVHVFGAHGLPSLSAVEMGEWLKRDIPSRYRDELVRDEPDGRPAPWVVAVEKRAGGLPAYLHLLLQEMREGAMHVGADVPRGLVGYFDRLLDHCGIDDPAAALPSLVSAVTSCVEPPETAVLEEVLRRGGHLHASSRAAHVGIVADALRRASVMLRVVRKTAGNEGWLLYHDELARHLSAAPRLANARAVAAAGLRAIALEPWLADSTEATTYGFEVGIRQLAALGHAEEAAGLFSDFGYLMKRLEFLDPREDVPHLLRDVTLVEGRTAASTRMKPWLDFLLAHAHQLERGGSAALLQLAFGEADASPVTAAAEAWLAEGEWRRPWLRRVGRPANAPQTSRLMTVEGATGGLALDGQGRIVMTGSADGTILVRDFGTGDCLERLVGHSGAVLSVALHPDGTTAVSSSEDGTLRVWDVSGGTCRHVLRQHSMRIHAVAMTSDGRRAVSASNDKTLRVWDLVTGASLKVLNGHEAPVRGVAITADGRRALSCSFDKTLRLWDLDEGRCVRVLVGHDDWVEAVALHADGRRAVSSSFDNTLRIWDVETGVCLSTLPQESFVRRIALTPDGRRVLSADGTRALRVWDLETGRCREVLASLSSLVEGIAPHPDGLRAVTVDRDNRLKVWSLREDVPALPEPLVKPSLTGEVQAAEPRWLALHPDGDRAFAVGQNNSVGLWDLRTRKRISELLGHSAEPLDVAVLPGGRQALTSAGDGSLRLWDLESAICHRIVEIAGLRSDISGGKLRVDSTGRWVALQMEMSLAVWDWEREALLYEFPARQFLFSPRTFSFSADGRRLLATAMGNTSQPHMPTKKTGAPQVIETQEERLLVLEAQTGKVVSSIGSAGNVSSVAWLPDGTCAACVDSRGSSAIEVFSADTGTALRKIPLKGPCVFSPDGALAVSQVGRALSVVDTGTGQEIARWEADEDVVVLDVSPGQRILCSDGGRSLLLEFVGQVLVSPPP